MWPDRVLNRGPLTLESDMLPTVPGGPAQVFETVKIMIITLDVPNFLIGTWSTVCIRL